ncbi:MAG: universal stress protein [Chloroflexi bacterium]|nr:universal stress protein [Chloroflexota bacterium]
MESPKALRPMQHVTILSEDRVFSALLARNLEAQGHRVDIHLVNPELPLSFLASPATWDTSLWVLDLSWYSEARTQTYAALAEWCRGQRRPAIMLVDSSWDGDEVRTFGAAATLAKPFPMTSFLVLVSRLGEGAESGEPGPSQLGDVKMELKERSAMIFSKWKPTYYRIVVPLDGSKLAESVLPVVATLADALGMEIMLLHVVPASGQPMRTPTPSQKVATAAISEYLQGIVQQLASQAVKVGWRVTSGDPVEDIIRYVHEAPADLIAMSTHGMGGDSRSPMGSVAAAVLERQTRPVLLIKPDKDVASW